MYFKGKEKYNNQDASPLFFNPIWHAFTCLIKILIQWICGMQAKHRPCELKTDCTAHARQPTSSAKTDCIHNRCNAHNVIKKKKTFTCAMQLASPSICTVFRSMHGTTTEQSNNKRSSARPGPRVQHHVQFFSPTSPRDEVDHRFNSFLARYRY
jgi:hypothetical protein